MFHIESSACPALLPDVPVGKCPRHQAGAIVWQATSLGLQVLLVERSSGRGWGIPKGGIERGESSTDAALREAWEEAGVEAKPRIQQVGQMRYIKRGRDQLVQLYSVEVQGLSSDWPEAQRRRRAWFSIEDAIREVGRFSGLQQVLEAFEPITDLKLVA